MDKPEIAFKVLSEVAFGGKSNSGFELDEVTPKIERYVEVLQKKVEILTKACEKIELTATLREDNLAITARRALKECKELG